jgi:ABC-type dipeptide/oligopeptide/nickel transport system permease subunit
MTQKNPPYAGFQENQPRADEVGGKAKRGSLLWARISSNKMLIIGGIVVIFFLFIAFFAPLITQYSPTKMDFRAKFAPPSAEHLMGTDHFGRDTYTRIVYGARVSFQVGLVAVSIGLIGGLIFGAVAGYVGGIADDILMRMMDALLAFPPLLLAIGLVASISIGVVYIPRFARVMRSSVLAEKEKEYVEAARAIGQSGFKILMKHIGPSTISPMIVLATIIFALAIIIEATLSFLGVGLPPPAPSWGTMLDESRRYLSVSAWMALFPGITISIAVLGFNMVGDGLRDLLDPRSYK